jgi:hypothetical protein
MTRTTIVVLAAAAGLALAACGSGASARSSTSPSPARGGQAPNGAAGQLVQINGQNLILTAATGDVTVTYSDSTTFTRTSSAVLADIVPGQCLVANGQKDSAGTLTATTVRLSPKTSTGCNAAGQFGPDSSPPPGASPRPTPSGSPRPIPSGQPATPSVAGEVTAAAGTSITVLTTASGSEVINVPTTATVTRMSSASSTDLRTGECLRANGSRDSAGAVEATSIAITPAGPSGSCTTGAGGRGPGRGGASPGGFPPIG